MPVNKDNLVGFFTRIPKFFGRGVNIGRVITLSVLSLIFLASNKICFSSKENGDAIESVLIVWSKLCFWTSSQLISYPCFLKRPFKFWKINFKSENFISSLLNRPGGIFLFAIPIIAEGHLLNLVRFKTETYGDYYTTYALTEHGFILGLIWFAIGIILTSQGDAFWESNKKNWRLHLALGMTSYFYRLFNNFIEDYALDNRLIAFESFNFIFALLGLAAVYLNKDSPQLTYYKTAVYPVYIVHLPVQMAVMYFFAGINIHPIIKFPIALFLICFLSLTIYHAIKNIEPLRPLFGLRNK